MSHLSIDHTYKRYEYASAAVTQWLSVTAHKASPSPPPYPTTKSEVIPKPPKPTPMPKGMTNKAKKAKNHRARKAKAEAEKNATSEAKKLPASEKSNVSISDFGALAKTIAVASSVVCIPVPDWVLCILADMAKVRRLLAKRFASSDLTHFYDSSSPAQDHQVHPMQELMQVSVDMLEKVHILLSAIQQTDGYPPTPPDSLPASSPVLTPASSPVLTPASSIRSFPAERTFKAFIGQDPYQCLFADSEVKAGQNWQEVSPKPECPFQPARDLDEELLMMQCFFEDFGAARKFIRQSWEGYREKGTELHAVGAITIAAVEFLEGIMKDMGVSFPNHDIKYSRFMELAALSIHKPEDPQRPAHRDIFQPFFEEQEDGMAVFSDSIWDAAEVICLPAYAILCKFRQDNRGCYQSSDVSRWNLLPTAGSNGAERYEQAKHILYHFLGELSFFLSGAKADTKRPKHITEPLFHAIWNMRSSGTNNIDPWLPFLCTIHLDICRALHVDNNSDMPQKDLLLNCHRIHRTIDDFWRLPEYIKIHTTNVEEPKNHHEKLFRDKHAQQIIMLSRDVAWIENDGVSNCRPAALNAMEICHRSDPLHLLKIHPLLCATLDWQFTLRMQCASIGILNDYGAVEAVAYLYSIVRSEMVYEHRGAEWRDMHTLLFLHKENFGEAPHNIQRMLERIQETTGFEADMLGHFGTVADWDVSTPRLSDLFEPQSTCCYLFEDSLLDAPLTAEKFRTEWAWTQSTFLTPERLCFELALCLKFEFCPLKFNYLHMHIRCMKLLHEIHLKLDDQFVQRFGPGYIKDMRQLPFLVAYVLTDLMLHRVLPKRKRCQQLKQQEHHRRNFRDCLILDSQFQYVTYANDVARPIMPVAAEHDGLELEGPALEPWCGNNDVRDYVPTVDDNNYFLQDGYFSFEDYHPRGYDGTVRIPEFFDKVCQCVDERVRGEGEWEHLALVSIKNPTRIDPAMNVVRRLTTPEEANQLMEQWEPTTYRAKEEKN